MNSIAIIGFGPFSQFFTPYITQNFSDVSVWNRSDKSAEAAKLGVKYVSLDEALSKDVIILSTSISFFEELLKNNAKKINPKAIVFDVASVKMKPVELMLKYLPQTCEIVATHPLFGPQSGKDGIEGKNMVICPIRTSKQICIIDFLANKLKLNVMVRTPEEHDKQMAYVQALTHFVARGIAGIKIPYTDQKTIAFEKLIDVRNLLAGDSDDLFLAIQNDNPFAKSVRLEFLNKLNDLNHDLNLENN